MEQLLYHLWKNRLFNCSDLCFTDGTGFEIIDPGIHNLDAGPDFFNAKLKIGDTIWAGNVELHTASSDWYAHHHNRDRAYDNVILNVISKYDCEVYRTGGDKIAQFVLPVEQQYLDSYSFLTSLRSDAVPCGQRISEIPPVAVADWISALCVERVITKASRFRELVDRYCGDWEEVLYIFLARSFGTGVNSEPFERLARSTPLLYLRKHIGSRLQTEALLMGQAGFLETDDTVICREQPSLYDYRSHPYYMLLQREYTLLRCKFRLHPINRSAWKLARMRPSSFPQLRIAALAAMLNTTPHLFSALLEAKTLKDIDPVFNFELSSFWDEHYCFEELSPSSAKVLGRGTINSILINALIPMLFAFGLYKGREELMERAMEFLEKIPPENNRLIRNFQMVGLNPRSAMESQALIQLHKEYCLKHRCFSCRFGNRLLSL